MKVSNSIKLHQRDTVLDALKLFAIFLVLWGHAIQYLQSAIYYTQPVYRFIYSFHMPLFMVLVGYFSINLYSKSFINVFIKRFRQLILPAVSFSVAWGYYLLHTEQFILPQFVNFIKFAFWFLRCAFICTIFLFITLKIQRSIPVATLVKYVISILMMYATLMVLGRYSPHTPHLNIESMYPCFVMGALLGHIIDHLKSNSKIYTLLSVSMFSMLYIWWDETVWTSPDSITLIIYRVAIGIAGSLSLILLFYTISPYCNLGRVGSIMCGWGKYTLGIYLLQSIMLEHITPLFINCDGMNFFVFNFIFTPILSILVLIICVYSIKLMSKNSVVAFLFLGHQTYPRFKAVNYFSKTS